MIIIRDTDDTLTVTLVALELTPEVMDAIQSQFGQDDQIFSRYDITLNKPEADDMDDIIGRAEVESQVALEGVSACLTQYGNDLIKQYMEKIDNAQKSAAEVEED